MTESLVIADELLVGRKTTIVHFYNTLLGRDPYAEELEYYYKSSEPLDRVYLCIKSTHYDSVIRNNAKLPISAVILAKNAEESMEMCLNSVSSFVSEIVVLEDASSTDATAEISKAFGARVYTAGFSGFGNMRTLNAHLARQPWVLQIDTDEILCKEEIPLIETLVQDEAVDIWGLPRRRWLDLEMNTQIEVEAYPDWQYRLFRNDIKIRFERRVHERIVGSDNIKTSEKGPHLEHYQDVFKTGDKLRERNKMYKELYSLDVKEGIKYDCPAVVDMDDI